MYTLYIGNKNYSSWSLRPWVLMKTAGIPFREERIPLYVEGSHERILGKSPSGRLPCLHDGERVVWDSLAIAEYLAERHPGLWPSDATARGWARSVAAEMHSGFTRLRDEFGMNVRLRLKKAPSPAVAEEIARIVSLWREGRERFGSVSVSGAFLCGSFGIVDAFWCPVAFRFQTYGVAVQAAADAYLQALLALPAMQEWATDSAREKERIPHADPPELQAQQQ